MNKDGPARDPLAPGFWGSAEDAEGEKWEYLIAVMLEEVLVWRHKNLRP